VPDVVNGLPGLKVTTDSVSSGSTVYWSDIGSTPIAVSGLSRVLFGAWVGTQGTNGLSSIALYESNSTGGLVTWFSIPVLNLPSNTSLTHYELFVSIPTGVQFTVVSLQCGQAHSSSTPSVCMFADVSIQSLSPSIPWP
jgi:hypothetical protein